MLSRWKRGLHLLKSGCYDQHISCSLDKPRLFYIFSSLNNKLAMLFWLRVVLSITSSVYIVISGNPRSHAEYLADSVNPVPKQVPRNCPNSKWSSLTWHLAHSVSAFVTNQLIWISLNQGANSTWWGRTRKVWGRTRHKVGANSKGRTR